ncbi:hypothetical protein Tco_0050043, partial [Tanacetum coccineum]
IPIVASSSHPKKTQKHRKTKRKATEISQSSGPTTHVADKTVHEDRGDRMERAAITASSLEAEQDSVNTLGSGEDIMKLMELIELYTKLSERVLALENIKTAQDLEITNLKKRVKRLEKKKKSRTPQLKRSTVGVTTASVPVSAASLTRPVDDSITDDITLAKTLMKIKKIISAKDTGKSIMQEPEKPMKMKGKDQIAYDAEVSQKPQE